jgi:hypothetical protein
MNVSVDDLQLGGAFFFGAALDLSDFDVHGASSVGDWAPSLFDIHIGSSAESPPEANH